MPITQITAPALKALLQGAQPPQLIDVRTPEEQAIARIAGAQLLDQPLVEHLRGLPRDTPLVFQCHHGIRSQHAAQHFEALGFTNLSNLVGGIEAWSVLVDPTVPRY
jgi:monothiol glutaredoxin